MSFDKSAFTFPSKTEYVFLAHCSVSPLYRGACREVQRLCEKQMLLGPFLLAQDYDRTLARLSQRRGSRDRERAKGEKHRRRSTHVELPSCVVWGCAGQVPGQTAGRSSGLPVPW